MDINEFTEKLLERSKQRKEFLKNKKVSELKKRRSETRCCDAEVDQLMQVESGLIQQDDSPKRQCLGSDGLSFGESKSDENKENTKNEGENIPYVPYIASQTKGLAALRKNKFVCNEPEQNNFSNRNSAEPKESQGFVRSPSAAKISYRFSKKNENNQVENNDTVGEESSDTEMDDCEKEKPLVPANKIKRVTSPAKCRSPKKVETVSEASKHPLTQGNTVNSGRDHIDPAELPLSARKALFEKAFFGAPSKQDSGVEPNLSVAQRAAMFEKASKFEAPKKAAKEPVKYFPSITPTPKTAKCKEPESPKIVTSTSTLEMKITKPCNNASPSKFLPSPVEALVLSPSKNAGVHTRLVQQRLIENSSSDWKKKDFVAKSCDERRNEISALLNHWEKVSTSSEPTCTDTDPHPAKSSSSSETEKQGVVFDEAENNEDDDDSSELEESSDDEQSSKKVDDELDNNNSEPEDDYSVSSRYESASEGYAADSANDDRYRSTSVKYVPVTDDVRSVCDEIDESICEASEIVDEVWETDDGMLPPSLPSADSVSKSSTGSSGNSYGSTSSQRETCGSQYNAHNYDDASDSELPLLHTVSFYRKQKQEKRTTPVRTIVRREQVASPPSPEVDNTKLIQEKIKILQEEIMDQQRRIKETSQALNLCHATEEFYGSTEQVECEKLLLIATQKRQACLNEIHRLKTHGALGKPLEEGTGTLTMYDIKLPLKRDFIASQLENKSNDAVHYFLCLVRHGHQVIVTQMLSTNPKEITNGSLCFTNHITLHELPPDFSIVFEVYALQTKKEVLPHEKKYHIRKEHSKLRLTPKGRKSDSKLLMPAVSSPGGPTAVRTPSFGVVGFTRFTLKNCDRKTCTLDKVPFSSPLDGVLLIKMQLHAEHNVFEKGFLTMFEDVSGFGAWHRRWVVLDGKDLSFWKYPDDERRKSPTLQIDLRQCITNQVKLVSRDVCARPHTFELVTIRPQEEGDRNTLISRSVNTLTTTKYLLSADTKDERIMWCKRLNESLTNVRKWDPNAMRPVEFKS